MSSLPSLLHAVTVYRQGATCHRRAELGAGADRQLRFGGLPLSLEPGSLRAKVVSGSGRVVDVRPQFDVELAQAVDVPAELQASEAAAAAYTALQERRARLEAEIDELQALAPTFLEPKRGEPPRPAPVDAMLALGDFREAELRARLDARRALDVQLEDAKEELTLRQRRLQEATTAKRTERSRLSRVAVVTLAEAPAGPFTLELEYAVPGARWVPNYTLTLARGMGSGTLRMRASVAQQTGEDWSQVRLSLSTANAGRRADAPELKALKIGRRQEAPQRSGWREPPPGLDTLFGGYDDAFGGSPPQGAVTPPRAAPRDVLEALGGVAPEPEMKKKAKSGAPPRPQRARMAPGAPPPPPPSAAPMRLREEAFDAAPAELASMSMARMSAKSKSLAPPAASRGGGAFGGAGAPMADLDDEAVYESEGGEPEAPDGYEGLPEASEPAHGLAEGLGDYARLTMTGPDGGAQRGRLVPASPWEFAFVAGVSVQVDFVVAMIGRAQRAAFEVSSLSLPPLTNPVTSVNAFDYRYDCDAPVDVPSTGKWALVPVMECAVGLSPEYLCVPSVEPKVYRTLTVTNRTSHALLPGPVDVTAGDEFLMTTSLPAIPPGADQAHRLGLGVEEAIKVARKTQAKETSGGFLGGSTVLPHEVEIEINNRLSTPALVEVRERLPVPEGDEKDLKVEETKLEPKWEVFEKVEEGRVVHGGRRWRVTVPPGQPMKLLAQYTIRMPADRMLVGGNRRS